MQMSAEPTQVGAPQFDGASAAVATAAAANLIVNCFRQLKHAARLRATRRGVSRGWQDTYVKLDAVEREVKL